MLQTYFLIIRATPSAKNHNRLTVPCVEAHFWARDRSAEGALRRARFYLEQKDWVPEAIELQPTLTRAMDYFPTGTEKAYYRQAQRFGIAMWIK
ncbi:MAG: hypothetical protein R2864_01485 [Syntrophotaleaceae bacterium]